MSSLDGNEKSTSFSSTSPLGRSSTGAASRSSGSTTGGKAAAAQVVGSPPPHTSRNTSSSTRQHPGRSPRVTSTGGDGAGRGRGERLVLLLLHVRRHDRRLAGRPQPVHALRLRGVQGAGQQLPEAQAPQAVPAGGGLPRRRCPPQSRRARRGHAGQPPVPESRAPHELLRLGVERAGGLVQQQDDGVAGAGGPGVAGAGVDECHLVRLLLHADEFGVVAILALDHELVVRAQEPISAEGRR